MGDNYEIWRETGLQMKVLEIYENKILQIFYESVNQIKRKL